MVARRAVLLAAAFTSFLAAGPALASTPGLVVDAGSGRVLFADRATDPWFPASVTKLMTTYVALDMVRRGQASMDTLLTMSPSAAAQPPSKIGLKPGQQMTLENALKIIMVKSANDIAHMIGENLAGGTVEDFAALMNDAARRLGMRESRWTNPSGLPDPRQQTSARDMALLARALITEFPDQEHLFRIGAVKLGSRVMRNHNGLLGRYPGADGMKTGFICSGGFNVVATATKGNRRLITVVFGYGTARERDLRAADLFDTGFSSMGWGSQSVDSLPPSASFTAPDMRPVVCGGKRRQPEEDDETAIVAFAPGEQPENPIAALFSSSAFATAPSAAPVLGARRTLGPRVAFTPIPVWIGAKPGTVADEGAPEARPVGVAAKPVRTKRLARGRDGALPRDAQAFAPTPVIEEGKKIETVRPVPAPSGRSALRAGLQPEPVAETEAPNGRPLAGPGRKPPPGAIGSGASGGGRRLGAISPKAGAGDAPAGLNPDAAPAPARGSATKRAADAKRAASPGRKAEAARGPARGEDDAER